MLVKFDIIQRHFNDFTGISQNGVKMTSTSKGIPSILLVKLDKNVKYFALMYKWIMKERKTVYRYFDLTGEKLLKD